MLNAIKIFFEQNISTEANVDMEHQLKLATAALMIEIMQQDQKIVEEERQSVMYVLKKKFELSDTEAQELFSLAQQEANDAVDYHQFTSLIARQYTQPQKIKVIEYLWTVAFADQHLDPYEEHMIRRIANLIYVSHRDLIKAKHKVQDEMAKGNQV